MGSVPNRKLMTRAVLLCTHTQSRNNDCSYFFVTSCSENPALGSNVCMEGMQCSAPCNYAWIRGKLEIIAYRGTLVFKRYFRIKGWE